MKKLIYTVLITFSFLLIPYPVIAFTNNFNVTIDEELITVTGNPGKSYTTEINIETMSTTQTVHLFGLSLPTPASYSASSWITPAQSTATLNNQSPTTISFTVTVPASAAAGEYYQAIAVSDKPFDDSETADPTTLVAVPVIIQISADATESTTTTTSSSSSSSSSSTSTTSTTQTTPSATTITPQKTKKTTTAKPKTSTPTPTLFSKLDLLSFTSSFNPFKLHTTFNLIIKNEGNIYSTPIGSIQVTNLKNNVLKNISINPQNTTLLPSKQVSYSELYKGKLYTVSLFKAKLNLINTDSQNQNQTPLTKQIYFFHINLIPVFLILVIVFLALSKIKNKKLYTVVCLTLLILLALISQQSSPKFLAETRNLNIAAEVKTQIGLKAIVNGDLTKTVLFTSTNPLGSTLFSLQNGARTSLDQVAQYSYGSFTTNLSYPQDSLPLMMITTGY